MGDVRLSLSLGVVLGYQGWSSVGAGLILPILVLFPVAVGTIIHRRITGSTSASREIAAGPGLVAGCALALALKRLNGKPPITAPIPQSSSEPRSSGDFLCATKAVCRISKTTCSQCNRSSLWSEPTN